MKKVTHSLAALAFTAVTLSFFAIPSSIRIIIYAFGFALGGINDWLDFTLLAMLPHRNRLTHGFFSPVGILLGIIGYFLGQFINRVPPLLYGGLFLGYFYLHLLLDMGNPTGVYGWGDRKITGSKYSSDGGANLTVNVIALAVLILVLKF